MTIFFIVEFFKFKKRESNLKLLQFINKCFRERFTNKQYEEYVKNNI